MKQTNKRKRDAKTALRRSVPAQLGAGNVVDLGATDQLRPPSSKCPDHDSTMRMFAKFHPDLLGDSAYAGLAESMSLRGGLHDASWLAPLQFQQDMHATDALERLAYTQILMAHARTAWLTKLATRQRDVQALAIILEACDRSSSTFVKLMRATSEYREPRNSTTTVSISRANVADQQFVRNLHPRGNDEQTRMKTRRTTNAEVVPAVGAGIEIAARDNPEKSAVGEKHGTKEYGGKGQDRRERATARRALRRHRQLSKTGKDHD